MSDNLFSHSVIAAVRTGEEFERALLSKAELIFDLGPDIFNLTRRIRAAHEHGKKLFVHLDLASGIGKDRSGVLFVKKAGADGIISTRVSTIKLAREQKIFTVQRFFIVDSQSVDTTIESCRISKPDMIEIMPGVIPKVIAKIKARLDIPVIAGGMIDSCEEIAVITQAGASAISTGNEALWQ